MRRLALIALILMLPLAGCGVLGHKESESDLPVANQLRAMVLKPEALGEYLDLTPFSLQTEIFTDGPRGERTDYTTALDRLGRSLSYTATFTHEDISRHAPGVSNVVIGVEQYESAQAAQSAVNVKKDSILTRWAQGADETAFSNQNMHRLQGVDAAWSTIGYENITVDNGLVRASWGVATFAYDNVVAYVIVEWGDDSGDAQFVDNVAGALLARVKAVREGKFDDSPDAVLTGADYLVLGANAMAGLQTYHVSSTRDFLIVGLEQSFGLEYDVSAPSTALGTVQVSGNPPVELLLRDRTPYYRKNSRSAWGCLGQGEVDPEAYGFFVPDFPSLFSAAREHESAAGLLSQLSVAVSEDGLVHLKTTVDAHQFDQFSPEILGSLSSLRNAFPALGDGGTVYVELVLRPEDYRLMDIHYEMQLPVPEGEVFVRTEMKLSNFDSAPVSLDETNLPLCQEIFVPPCKGDRLNACLRLDPDLSEPAVSRNACAGQGRRVCVVPIGAVSKDLLMEVIADLEALTGEPIAVLPAVPVGGADIGSIDDSRDQVSAQVLERTLYKDFPEFDDDEDVVLIGVTPVDMFPDDQPQYVYEFGQRFWLGGSKNVGVISYFRMENVSYGEPPDDEMLKQRLEKMMLKYILGMRFDVPDSTSPTSVMYGKIGGLDDLDAIKLAVPPGALP